MAAPGNFVYVPDTIDNQQWNIVSESFAVACAGAVHTGATVRINNQGGNLLSGQPVIRGAQSMLYFGSFWMTFRTITGTLEYNEVPTAIAGAAGGALGAMIAAAPEAAIKKTPSLIAESGIFGAGIFGIVYPLASYGLDKLFCRAGRNADGKTFELR